MAQTCPPPFRSAFLGEPRLTTLPRGERLYKLVSLPVDRGRVLASPWWIRQRDFRELQLRADALGRSVTDMVRVRLAIAREWNPGMDVLWIVELGAAVEAWEGKAKGQPETLADRDVLLIGGGIQVCVPTLTWRQIAVDFAGHVVSKA